MYDHDLHISSISSFFFSSSYLQDNYKFDGKNYMRTSCMLISQLLMNLIDLLFQEGRLPCTLSYAGMPR